MILITEDQADMSLGIVPKSLLKDNLHFTDVENKIVATAMYKRMEYLGYFEEIRRGTGDILDTERYE